MFFVIIWGFGGILTEDEDRDDDGKSQRICPNFVGPQ